MEDQFLKVSRWVMGEGGMVTMCLLMLGMVITGAAYGSSKTLPNGDEIQYDGTYYDFRAANGRQMIKIWVPPDADPVRGVFISGHGGGSGDSRDFARDENMKAVAARFGFGLAGLHTFPGRRTYDEYGELFFKTLEDFAALGHHPELANIPFVMMGHSNGGSTTYGFVNYAPERAVCFVTNVSTWFNPPEPTDGALLVPGILCVGQFDPFSREEQGVQAMTDLVTGARARGARWAMMAEEKGHEDGVTFDLYLKLVEQTMPLRYPADADPREGPVKLNVIPEEDGWLADMGSWRSGITKIAPYDEYEGDKSKAGWLLNKDMAYLYRGGATHQNPISIGIEEVDRVYNPNTDPGGMFSVGGPVVDPGRTLKLVCDVREMPDWSKIEFFNGAEKLGEVSAPAKPVLSVKVPASDIVWCLTAVGHTKSGELRTAAPFYFTVRDPDIELRSEAERGPQPKYEDRTGPVGSKTAQNVPQGYEPKAGATEENVLIAYGLTADQEKSFASEPGEISPFWREIDEAHDVIEMNQRTHAREDSQFSIVTTADARMKVKAAHSARGLYLYFEVMDNYFHEASDDPNLYFERDAIDVLIDSKSTDEIHDPSNVTQAINAGWDLYLTTKQFQVAFGRYSPPDTIKHVFPDPWDVVFGKIYQRTDLEDRYGVKIHYAKIDSLRRVQEWFIPWSALGRPGDIPSEPPVGKRFAFALGYNDWDSDTVQSKQLRWIDHTTPWTFAADSEETPRGWGDIEIGPMIGSGQ